MRLGRKRRECQNHLNRVITVCYSKTLCLSELKYPPNRQRTSSAAVGILHCVRWSYAFFSNIS